MNIIYDHLTLKSRYAILSLNNISVVSMIVPQAVLRTDLTLSKELTIGINVIRLV